MGITTFRIKSQIGHLFGSRHGTMAITDVRTKSRSGSCLGAEPDFGPQ